MKPTQKTGIPPRQIKPGQNTVISRGNVTQNHGPTGAPQSPYANVTPSHTPRYRVSSHSGGTNPRRNGTNRVHPKLKAVRTVRRIISDVETEIAEVPAKLIDRFNSWRLAFTIDPETVLKAVVIGLLLVFFTVLQTTLFTRFRPFGAIPDLILPFVITVGIIEKEKFGGVVAPIAAYVIDSAGGTTITLLPLLYVPCAIAAGYLTTHRFRDSLIVSAMYTGVSSAARGIITAIIVLSTLRGVSAGILFTDFLLPEFAANVVLAAFPQILTRVALRPFHKTRDERVGNA